jgi:zinc/manganese transport system substrate-binding protein
MDRTERPAPRTAVLVTLALVAASCSGGGATSATTTSTTAGTAETTSTTSPAGDAPLVVVTTTILGDIVANVAGDDAVVEVIMPVGADPHTFEPSARQAARFREADLIVVNGLEFEEGLLAAIEAAEADGANVLELGELLDPMPFTGAHDHADDDHDDDHADDDHADDDHDDDHEGGLDPHVWMDPVRMIQAVDIIATELAPLAGGGVAARADSYKAELEALHEEIAQMIESIPAERRVMVTNHFAYGYYADRYGLEILGAVIPAATTDAETSARDFAELIELIEAEDVPAIFASTTEPTRLAESIAGEVGRDVAVIELYTESLGESGSGADTYVGMMRTSTERIVEGLTA